MRLTGLLGMKYERSFLRKICVDVVVVNGSLRFIHDFRKLFFILSILPQMWFQAKYKYTKKHE